MTHAEKWQHLVHRTNKAQMAAIIAGYDPTEVWLGPKEIQEFAEYTEYAKKMGYARKDAKTPETKLLGLTVMESKKDGIRVGVTFSPPAS